MTSNDIPCLISMIVVFLVLVIVNFTVIKPWGKTEEEKKHQ